MLLALSITYLCLVVMPNLYNIALLLFNACKMPKHFSSYLTICDEKTFSLKDYLLISLFYLMRDYYYFITLLQKRKNENRYQFLRISGFLFKYLKKINEFLLRL